MTQLNFQHLQHKMCQHIRQGTIPDLLETSFDSARICVYQDLIRNNIHGFLDRVFPVTQALLTPEQWDSLCEEFIAHAQCKSPFYNDISLEFQTYLHQEDHFLKQELPWLMELLQFEWLELFLELTPNIIEQKVIPPSPWQLHRPYWILVYQYPVFSWTIETQLNEIIQQPHAIMAWRNQANQFQVEVIEPVQALLLEIILKEASSTSQLVETLKTQLTELSELECLQYVECLQLKLQQLDFIHS